MDSTSVGGRTRFVALQISEGALERLTPAPTAVDHVTSVVKRGAV